jgi:peptide deformylase
MQACTRYNGRFTRGCDRRHALTPMSLLPILEYPHPRLRNVARTVEAERVSDPAFQRLLDDMLQTMYEAPGIGLAAPQVDVHERFMVIDVTEGRDQPLVFINPVIRDKSVDLRVHQEGCLSIPGVYADVTRPDGIVVEALDRHGKPFELRVDGLLATCVQHEVDHLDGRLFIDYLSPLKRDRALKKLEKLRRQQG